MASSALETADAVALNAVMAQGFTETEIMDGLIKLTHDKAIELLPGNQLRVLSRRIPHVSFMPTVR